MSHATRSVTPCDNGGMENGLTFEVVSDLFRALEHHEVNYVLVGSLAMAVQGIVRATEDLDLFVKPEAGNIEKLKRSLKTLYEDEVIDEITVRDLSGPYPVIEYCPPNADYRIDLIARLGGVRIFRHRT